MIFPETFLNIIDNGGAKTAKCLKILHNRFPGTVGELCYCSNKEIVTQEKNYGPGEIHLAVITETRAQSVS